MTPPPPVLLVRLLPGVVGESRRVVHVVPAPAGDVIPDLLVAYCGERIAPGAAERLDGPAGMPCERCGRAAITAPTAQ